MSKFDELMNAPIGRIEQAIGRKIRQFEDEALVAIKIGDSQAALEAAQKAEFLEALINPERPGVIDELDGRMRKVRATILGQPGRNRG